MSIFSNLCTASVHKPEPIIQTSLNVNKTLLENPKKRYPLSFLWEGIQSNKQTCFFQIWRHFRFSQRLIFKILAESVRWLL